MEGTSLELTGGDQPRTNVYLQDVQYAVIGDGTIINVCEQKDPSPTIEDTVNKNLSTLRILPGKPFHECFTRIQDIHEMSSLFEKMSDPNQLDCLSAIFLTGPPGSGKTQLARQFGEHFLKPRLEHPQTHSPVVLTLNVDSVKSLLRSTKELLESLGLSTNEDINKEDGGLDTLKTRFDELRKALRNYPGDWLLIFDNLFRDEIINDVLPKPGSEDWGRGKIIVTSQDNDVVPAGHANTRNHSLEEGMQPSDAYTLLSKVSCLEVDESAKKLAAEVDYFPLSLACCATYVRQMVTDRPKSAFSWKQFSDLYHGEKISLKYRTYVAHNVYPHSMVIATRLAVMRLASCSTVLQHAFEFLSYCALKPVPLDIISCFVQERGQPDNIATDEIKAEISRCSLLTASGFEAGESIRFHQVMLEAFKYLKDETSSSLSDNERQKEYVLMLKSLNVSLETAIPNYDRRSVTLKILASSHLKAFIEYGNSKSWNNSQEFVVVLACLADSLYHVPESTETERVMYIEQAYKTSEKLPECAMMGIKYCQVLKCLGFYYRESGRVDESVPILAKALALTEAQIAQDWLRLRSSILNVLSWSYKLQSNYDLAETTMQESIELAKTTFGEENEEIVERLCNLSIIYREKDQMDKAKATIDEARRIARITTDELHLNRAQAANFSAKIYLRCAEACTDQKEKHLLLHESLKFHAEALRIYDKILGESHIYVAGVCMTYAIVNKELKAFSLALEQVERAEMIYSKLKHVELRSALRYKTEVLLAMANRSDEAEQVIKKSIELSNCGRARFLLAQVHLQQMKFLEARTILQELVVRWKSGILPKTHFWIKQAEQLKSECEKEILKLYAPTIFVVFFLFLSILFGIIFLGS